MKLTTEADTMIQELGKIHTAEYLATVLGLAERAAREEMCPRVATFHIGEAMDKVGDPIAPDYDALAEVEPTSQVEDSRDAAEVVA